MTIESSTAAEPASPAPTSVPTKLYALQVLLVFGGFILFAVLSHYLEPTAFIVRRAPSLSLPAHVLQTGSTTLLLVALALRLEKAPWSSVGLRSEPVVSAIKWGLLGALLTYLLQGVLVAALVAIAKAASTLTAQSPPGSAAPPNAIEGIAREKANALGELSNISGALILPTAFFVGFYEEVFARGLLLTRLRSLAERAGFSPRRATITGVLISSMLFGVLHIYQGAFGALQTFIAGCFLGVLAVYRQNLWASIVAHATIDAFGLFALKYLVPMLQRSLEQAQTR